MNDLVNSFIVEAKQLVARAQQAAQTRDLDQLMRATHQLRGLGLCFEVEQMAALVADIEAAANDDRWQAVEPELVKIANIIEAVNSSFNGTI